MGAYFIRRLLLMIPTFIGITFLAFSITRFVPGGPIEQMMQQAQQAAMSEGGAGASQAGTGQIELTDEQLALLTKQFYLDQPFPVAYALWLRDMSIPDVRSGEGAAVLGLVGPETEGVWIQPNFGESFREGRPVWDSISSRFPISLYFGLLGFFLAYSVCVPLGILKAVKHGSAFDLISSALVFIGYSVPGWAVGAVLLVLLGGGSLFDVFPLGGFRSDDWETFSLAGKITDQVHHTVLPVIAYMLGSFATLTVLMKNSLMENLGQDYVRTAFAKGLHERRVVFLHALRNSLIPIMTGLGHAIGIIMAGSYFIELVFNIPGLGKLGYDSIIARDYPVVMGIFAINTSLVLLGNILSDVLYVLVDPRIRFS